jgi:hypothetical protein
MSGAFGGPFGLGPIPSGTNLDPVTLKPRFPVPPGQEPKLGITGGGDVGGLLAALLASALACQA